MIDCTCGDRYSGNEHVGDDADNDDDNVDDDDDIALHQ